MVSQINETIIYVTIKKNIITGCAQSLQKTNIKEVSLQWLQNEIYSICSETILGDVQPLIL